MIIHNHPQGSPEWLELRAKYFTASEAPSMLGASKYQTRTALLAQKAAGIVEEVDANTQALFDRGHAAEAAARPIAERIIGDDLFPTTVSEVIDGLPLLASLDGMTMDGNILFEHKLYSQSLAEQVKAGTLGSHYTIQMDQQMLITGAEKTLFMCSDGTEDKCVWMWYYRNPASEAAIVSGWSQFLADIAAYEHFYDTPVPAGKAPETLPALRIELTGMVTASNLVQFRETAMAVIEAVKTDLQTDADFADAEKAVKWCGDVESRIVAAKDHALSQTASIDELFRTLDEIKDYARAKRLNLTNLVKARKESVRVEIQQAAVADLRSHYDQINTTLAPCSLTFPADFAQTVANAMKGKKTVASLRDAATTAAAHAKMAVSQLADRTRLNLKTMAEHEEYRHLFADLNMLATSKAPDDFKAVAALRIQEHKAKVEREAEEQRAKIRAEEEARANREAEEKAEQERERIREEEREAIFAEVSASTSTAPVEDQRGKPAEATHAEPQATATPQAPAASTSPIKQTTGVSVKKATRPTDAEIIGTLALKYRVHESKIIEWLLGMDLNAESEKLASSM